MTEQEREKYVEFMYNPENIRSCRNCPENQGMDDWQDRLPCGQWHCWVAVHCFPERFRWEGK